MFSPDTCEAGVLSLTKWHLGTGAFDRASSSSSAKPNRNKVLTLNTTVSLVKVCEEWLFVLKAYHAIEYDDKLQILSIRSTNA